MRQPSLLGILSILLLWVTNLTASSLPGNGTASPRNTVAWRWEKRPILTITKSTTFCSLCVTTSVTPSAAETTSVSILFITTTIETTKTETETETATEIDIPFLTTSRTHGPVDDFSAIKTNEPGEPTTTSQVSMGSMTETDAAVPFLTTTWTGNHTDAASTIDSSAWPPESINPPRTDPTSTCVVSDVLTPQNGGYGGILTSKTSGPCVFPSTLVTVTTSRTNSSSSSCSSSSCSSSSISESSSSAGTGWSAGAEPSKSSTSSQSPAGTGCPVHDAMDINEFTLNFDDVLSNQDKMPAPLHGPYHHFHFSEGFHVFQVPRSRFLPSSGSGLVSFRPPGKLNNSNSTAKKQQQQERVAYIGAGPNIFVSCLRFDMHAINIGCESEEGDCEFRITGHRAVEGISDEETVAKFYTSIPPCKVGIHCRLLAFPMPSEFRDLTSIWVESTADGEPVAWWADDLALQWTDHTCQAALCRSGVSVARGRHRRSVGMAGNGRP